MRTAGKFLLIAITALLSVSAAAEEAVAVEETGGWIDLFDGQTTFGWTPFGDAEWEVDDGILQAARGSGGALVTTSQFTDFELTAKVRVKAGCSSGIAVRAGLEGHPSENGSAVVWLHEEARSKPPWRDLRITALGDTLAATVDGKEIPDFASARARGYIAILYHHNRKAKVEIAEMKLRPLGLRPIFNGTDLSGWNIIPDHRSKFTVVDGAINIKDGNGQIETAGVYKDFLLQLDIFSNGDHLNSGVFFRGPPGQFWKGYESQVRNQWRGDDRTKPVDYGTGGNYGNQPAREVLSSDRQWFRKTIVCEGNHTAVWIDGRLVSDFYDTRPPSLSSNGKEGYVPGPGTIHLQGHDPTTDLSFKNINLQVYP